jgi:hypothetical protein
MPKVCVLLERDGRETYAHGAYLAPEGKGEDDVRADLARAYREVWQAFPVDWNYDDVDEALARLGYRYLDDAKPFCDHKEDCWQVVPVRFLMDNVMTFWEHEVEV